MVLFTRTEKFLIYSASFAKNTEKIVPLSALYNNVSDGRQLTNSSVTINNREDLFLSPPLFILGYGRNLMEGVRAFAL